jgi:hypothetical protein
MSAIFMEETDAAHESSEASDTAEHETAMSVDMASPPTSTRNVIVNKPTPPSSADPSRKTTPTSSGSVTPHSRPSSAIGSFRKRKQNDTQELTRVVANAFSNVTTAVDAMCMNTPDDDEDLLFAKSVAKALNRFPNGRLKARVKIELLEVLEKYED